MAPVCDQCKQAVSSLYPGKPIDNAWRDILCRSWARCSASRGYGAR